MDILRPGWKVRKQPCFIYSKARIAELHLGWSDWFVFWKGTWNSVSFLEWMWDFHGLPKKRTSSLSMCPVQSVVAGPRKYSRSQLPATSSRSLRLEFLARTRWPRATPYCATGNFSRWCCPMQWWCSRPWLSNVHLPTLAWDAAYARRSPRPSCTEQTRNMVTFLGVAGYLSFPVLASNYQAVNSEMDSRCPRRDSKGAPPQYKSRSLLLQSVYSVWCSVLNKEIRCWICAEFWFSGNATSWAI
jgi:hypothetical protein